MSEQLRQLDKDLDRALDIKRAKEAQQRDHEFNVDLVEQAVNPVLEALYEQSEINKQVFNTINASLVEQSKSFDKSIQAVSEAIKAVKVDVPEIKVPNITVPEVKIPDISVPEAKVNIDTKGIENTLKTAFKGLKAPIVNVPEAKVEVNVPKMDFEWPEGDMSVRGVMELAGVDIANPLPVQLRDSKGKPVDFNFGGTSGGSRGYKSVKIENSDGDTVDSFGEPIYPVGSGSNGSVTLTNANTAYAVPTTASTEKHILILYNGSDADMYWGFANSNANGILLPPDGKATMNMGASQQIYAYCASAGKVITYSYKEII